MTATPIEIRVIGLGKSFWPPASWSQIARGRFRGPAVTALRGIDLSVSAGEIATILGENGAGKTTLLRCIAGLTQPDTGSVELAPHHRVSYVISDGRSFSWRISGRANLEFFAALHGLRGRAARRRIDEALDRVGLSAQRAGRRVAEYSTGMRLRLALARGLLGRPHTLLFDEPTAGLDPRRADDLLRYLVELSGQGRTLLVATHSLACARALGGRAIVLRDGAAVHDGDVDAAETLLLEPPAAEANA